MSKSLDYLLQARPEAMNNYFAFLKEAGKHLDPKTRAIISVITKVDKQTESGFRQYLKRALNEGVSADEILDALLMAFPTLGLTKIIWAIDRLIEMDLPEFSLDNLGAGETWHNVADLQEISRNKVTCIKYEKGLLFIHADKETIHVYDNQCPHRHTRIPDEAVDGNEVVCPKHNWKFDLQTGECTEVGNKPLKQMPCKVENNRLLVQW